MWLTVAEAKKADRKYVCEIRENLCTGCVCEIGIRAIEGFAEVVEDFSEDLGRAAIQIGKKTSGSPHGYLKHFRIRVQDDNRGCGIGTELLYCLHHMVDVIDPALKRIDGCEANPENEAFRDGLLRFYRKCGFVVSENGHKIIERKRICPLRFWMKLHFDKKTLRN
ncbi:GNAT family N-acetyltransferase [Adlercreutzia murintestinalis]|jgi:hypothetical protein|uniref:GNAT family N-acetyltransferase n=1 Tax=Adlercreutzia murintestinalis TaxID=2941325 RepID=UPI00203B738B|nr:GNAT family N-acetyltransferase [Adlercreutzia murintestinalis]